MGMNGEALTPNQLASLPCDFCKARPAPFGFAPPPHLGIAVRRPIKTCGAPGCQAKAKARVADLVAGGDPLARSRKARAALAPAPRPRQGRLGL